MFIGTDTDGNMFTSFFDLETGAPFIIRYSKYRSLTKIKWIDIVIAGM